MLKEMHVETQDSNVAPETAELTDTQPLAPTIAATAPGELKVIKRNGAVVPYHDDKITVALTKAFLAVEGGTAAASPRIAVWSVNSPARSAPRLNVASHLAARSTLKTSKTK